MVLLLIKRVTWYHICFLSTLVVLSHLKKVIVYLLWILIMQFKRLFLFFSVPRVSDHDVTTRAAYYIYYHTWWRHQMETFSALLTICAGNSPITGEFHSQRPVTRSFGVFFDLRLNKRLSKQSWGWWFETPSRPLWRHCNDRSIPSLACGHVSKERRLIRKYMIHDFIDASHLSTCICKSMLCT